MPESTRFYPALSSFISLDELGSYPILAGLGGGLNIIFGKIFIKDFQHSRSPLGDNAFFSMVVISKERLDFKIPGTDIFDPEGIVFVLNPDHGLNPDATVSTFPITISYSWPILAHLRTVSTALSLVESPNEAELIEFSQKVFDLAQKVFRLSQTQVLARAINAFAIPADSSMDNFEKFILDFNDYSGNPLDTDADHIDEITGDDPYGQLLTLMTSITGETPDVSIFNMYIFQEALDETFNLAETLKKLNQFYRNYLPDGDIGEYLKDMLIPKFSASLKLTAALEFPRSMLVPVIRTLEVIDLGNGNFETRERFEINEDTNTKVQFGLNYQTFLLHSHRGFTNDLDLTFSTNTYAQIGNSGLILNVTGLKVDISDERNIPEADLDNRPLGFKGVYISEVALYLPKGFSTAQNQLVSFKAEDLLVGTNGPGASPAFGVSGHFFLDIPTGSTPGTAFKTHIGSLELFIDGFDLYMHQNAVISFASGGYLRFPGASADLGFGMSFADGEYTITASYAAPFTIGNVAVTIPGDVIVVFSKDGVTSVSGTLNLTFDFNGELVNISAALGYSALTGDVTLLAEIGGLHFDIGPFGITPSSFGLAFGPGGLSEISFTTMMTIDGIKKFDPDGNETTEDQEFEISFSRTDTSTEIELLNAQEARLFGLKLNMQTLHFTFNNGGPVDGEAVGQLLIPPSAGSTDPETPIGFTIDNTDGPWKLKVLSAPAFVLGQATIQLQGLNNDPALYVVFDGGIQDAGARAIVTFEQLKDENGAPVPIVLNGGLDNGTILFSANSSALDLELKLGPVTIEPNAVDLRLGGGSFEGGIGAYVMISDVKEENATNNNGEDRKFYGVLQVMEDHTRIALVPEPTNIDEIPTPPSGSNAPAATKGKAAGVEFEITTFDISFNNTGILPDSEFTGNLTINRPDVDGSPVSPISLFFDIDCGETSAGIPVFHVAVTSTTAIVFNELKLEFWREGVGNEPDEVPSKLEFTFTKDGIFSGHADFKLTHPKLVDPADESTQVPVYIGADYNRDANGFAFQATGLSGLHFSLGKVLVVLESFAFSFVNGNFESAVAEGDIIIQDCKDPDTGFDRTINATIGIFQDHMHVELASGQTEDQRKVKLRSIELTMTSINFRFDENGFYTGHPDPNSAGAHVHIDNGSIDEEFDLVFEFTDTGYGVHLSQASIELVDVEQVQVTLKKLGFFKDSAGLDFEIGGVITTDLHVPALTKMIPELVDIKKIAIDQDGTYTYDLLLRWEGGAEMSGNSETGFGGYLPVDGLSIGDGENIKLDKLLLEANTANGSLTLDAEFYGLTIKIGPVVAVADGMGLRTIVESKPAGDGNFGNSHLSFDFIRPKGLGVSIKAGKVEAAGYLFLDYENERYYGYLSIHVGDFGLDAIGIYSKTDTGYSFLAMITVDLPTAIPLVFGFYLQGVGGLIGLHRTMNPEALREGVRTGALDQLLFPENILENIHTIITQMEGYFPIQQGRHTFGIFADLTYGDTDMIHIELGVLLSLPEPLIIAIGGTVKVQVPVSDSPKLVINCAFLGVLDFGASLMTFDARIYDSQIAGIGIEGDIAARFGWGNNKMFMISAGGFHPQFVPDPAWKTGSMMRMALRIVDRDDLKIFAETYFAVTSNTFQIGARAELIYKSGDISAEAYAGFDALFYFNPFHFTVSVSIGAEVSWKSHTLMGVHLSAMLTGPGEWNARGNASFEILIFELGIDFEISWGSGSESGLPAVDVMQLLIAELGKNESWKGDGKKDNLIVYKPLEAEPPSDAMLILSPMDNLLVQQLVVPLEYTLTKFGENPVGPDNYFKIHELKIGGDGTSTAFVEDYFAPGQYRQLGDQQRLQSASFELMKSGVRSADGSVGVAIPPHCTYKLRQYEQVYKDVEPDDTSVNIQAGVSMIDFVRGGALGRHPSFRAQKRKEKKKNMVRVKETEYRVTDRNNLMFEPGHQIVKSRAQAEELLRQHLSSNQSAASRLRAAPSFEYKTYVLMGEEETGGGSPD